MEHLTPRSLTPWNSKNEETVERIDRKGIGRKVDTVLEEALVFVLYTKNRYIPSEIHLVYTFRRFRGIA